MLERSPDDDIKVKSDTSVQTEDALKTVGYISDLIPHIEVARIAYFVVGEKIRTGPLCLP